MCSPFTLGVCGICITAHVAFRSLEIELVHEAVSAWSSEMEECGKGVLRFEERRWKCRGLWAAGQRAKHNDEYATEFAKSTLILITAWLLQQQLEKLLQLTQLTSILVISTSQQGSTWSRFAWIDTNNFGVLVKPAKSSSKVSITMLIYTKEENLIQKLL